MSEGKLKVAWIEDKLPIELPIWLQPFVSLRRFVEPRDAEAALRAEMPRTAQSRGGSDYALSEFPYDIYIADHKLSEGDASGAQSLAAMAEAAGLSSAVLLACNAPDHPATILPYTAYHEQIRSQRDLLRRLCPEAVNVVWQEEVLKGELAPTAALERAIEVHRGWMVNRAAAGDIHLRFRERERLLKAVANASTEWPGKDAVAFETPWGTRRFYLAGLFPEVADNRGVAADPVRQQIRAWLEMFPAPTRSDETARLLAFLYLGLSQSKESEAFYQELNQVRQGHSTEAKMPDTGCSPIWTQDYDQGTLRLAILYLMVLEEARRALCREALAEDPDLEDAFLGALPGRVLQFLEEARASRGIDKASEGLNALLEGCKAGLSVDRLDWVPRKLYEGLEEFLLRRENAKDPSERAKNPLDAVHKDLKYLFAALPLWQRVSGPPPLSLSDLERLLDPLPQLDAPDPTRVNKGLRRLDLASPGNLLRQGPSQGIHDFERRSMRAFALDQEFPESEWPAWMR